MGERGIDKGGNFSVAVYLLWAEPVAVGAKAGRAESACMLEISREGNQLQPIWREREQPSGTFWKSVVEGNLA